MTDAEALADSVQWKVAGERLRELLDEWKSAPHVDRATEQAMWKRFGAARNSFDRRRRQHFAQLSAQQSVVKAAKQKLIAEAESARDVDRVGSDRVPPARPDDRVEGGRAHGPGRGGRALEPLPSRPGPVLRRPHGLVQRRDAKLSGNLAKKEALLVEAEALLPVTDLGAAKAGLRGVEERWEAAGHVPRGDQRTDRDAPAPGRRDDPQGRRHPMDGAPTPRAAPGRRPPSTSSRSAIDKLEKPALGGGGER